MKPPTRSNARVALLLMLLATFACSTLQAYGDLSALVEARDDKAFDDALRAHGPVREDELPLILKAVDHSSARQRRNAAQLLRLVHGDRNRIAAAQSKVVAETKDVIVWAIVLDALLDPRSGANREEVAGKRREMIEAALHHDEGLVRSVGIKAAILVSRPGIEEIIKKHLGDQNTKVQLVVLDALTPKYALENLATLRLMLSDYDAGAKKYASELYVSLVNALVRSEAPEAYTAVRASLEKDYKNHRYSDGQRQEASTFYNEAATSPNDWAYRFLLYLVKERSRISDAALDALTRQVWAGRRDPSRELVQICAARLEESVSRPTTNRYDEDALPCEWMLYFIETGANPVSNEGKVKHGKDALALARKWLKENGG
jgi:hypothetical protein